MSVGGSIARSCFNNVSWTVPLALLWLLTGCSATPDTPPTVREFASPAPPGSAEPHLVATASRLHLSWLKHEETGHEFQYATLQSAAWSPARTISAGENFFANWADRPSVVELSDGSLLAHWLEKTGTEKYAYGVRLSHSTDGVAWSAAIEPHHDGTPTEHGFVSILPDGSAGAMIFWLDGRNFAGKEHDEAETQIMSALWSGGTTTPEVAIDPRTCDCCPTTAVRTDRGVLVAYRDRSDDEVRDIWLVRHEDGAWSEPYALADDGWMVPGCPVNGPVLEAEGNRVVATWFTMAESETPSGSHGASEGEDLPPGLSSGAERHPVVRVAFSEDSGRTFPIKIRVDDGNPEGRPDVVLLPSGAALVTWLVLDAEGSAEIRARRVLADGTLEDSFLVSATSPERASGFPQMERLGNQVYLAWTEVGTPSNVRMASLELPRSWR